MTLLMHHFQTPTPNPVAMLWLFLTSEMLTTDIDSGLPTLYFICDEGLVSPKISSPDIDPTSRKPSLILTPLRSQGDLSPLYVHCPSCFFHLFSNLNNTSLF